MIVVKTAMLGLPAVLLNDYQKEDIKAEQGQEIISLDNNIMFPSGVMTGVAGDFANLYSQYLESPKEFFYFSFLTCLGSFLSDRLTARLEIAPQPRFYTILIGESADDRKSTAADKTISFFKECFIEGFHTCYGVGSAEGLQKRLEKAIPSRLLLFFDEFKQFTGKCKIESSILLPCVNTLFESNRYESQTKLHPLILKIVIYQSLAVPLRLLLKVCGVPLLQI